MHRDGLWDKEGRRASFGSTQPCKTTDLRGFQLRRGTCSASLRCNAFAPYPPDGGKSLTPFNMFFKKRAARGGPSNEQVYAMRLSVFSDHFEHVGTAPMQDGAHGIQAKTDNGFGFDERWTHEFELIDLDVE